MKRQEEEGKEGKVKEIQKGHRVAVHKEDKEKRQQEGHEGTNRQGNEIEGKTQREERQRRILT